MPRRAVLIALLVLACSACGSSGPLEPLVVGTQQFFSIEWSSVPRGSQRLVQGYIKNNWGFAAANVRLLVDALEPDGRLLTQRIIWLGGQLTPGTRAYFETAMPPAPTYRVRVFAYDWVQSPEMFSR